jgi:hypothetical protein
LVNLTWKSFQHYGPRKWEKEAKTSRRRPRGCSGKKGKEGFCATWQSHRFPCGSLLSFYFSEVLLITASLPLGCRPTAFLKVFFFSFSLLLLPIILCYCFAKKQKKKKRKEGKEKGRISFT